MVNLAGMGSFHVGGRAVAITGQPSRTVRFTADTSATFDPNGTYWIEQAWVQWFRPAAARTARTTLFVHGGGMTGAMWETTPDGRPGWTELFLHQGLPVAVIDQVERGRAGWCSLPGVWRGEPLLRSLEDAWTLFRFGPADGFARRAAFSGLRFPITHLDQLAQGFVPRWTTNGPAQRAALIAAIARLGPCDLIAHSQGAEAALHAAAQLPGLVRSVVLIEGSGGFDAKLARNQRLAIVLGDRLDATPLWQALAPRIRDHAARHAAHVIDPAQDGAPGHSHLPMMDFGHDEVAARIVAWLLG